MNTFTKSLFLVALIILVGVLISWYIKNEGYTINTKPPGMNLQLKGDIGDKEGYDNTEFTGFPEAPVGMVPPTTILPMLEIPAAGRMSKTDLILLAQNRPDTGIGPAPVGNPYLSYARDQREVSALTRDLIKGY